MHAGREVWKALKHKKTKTKLIINNNVDMNCQKSINLMVCCMFSNGKQYSCTFSHSIILHSYARGTQIKYRLRSLSQRAKAKTDLNIFFANFFQKKS